MWFFPLVLFIIIAPFTPWLDLTIAHHFYHDNSFEKNAWISFLYHYGTWPAWIAAAFCLWKIKAYKKCALLYLLTFALGAGLIANGILKNFWERPRPVQTVEFGGFAPYHPFWIPVTEHYKEPCKSFPSGHATMGFVFIAFCLAGYRMKNKPIFFMGLFLTLFLGISLSYTRIAQGGHYFSDTLASLLIMWLTAVFTEKILWKA